PSPARSGPSATRAKKPAGQLSGGLLNCEGLARALLRFLEQEGDVVPVHQIVEPGLQVLRTRVAVVDVVAVLPHVDAQQRMRIAVHQRVLAVRRLADLELAVLEAEPGPARPELGGTGVDEIGAELVEAAEILV